MPARDGTLVSRLDGNRTARRTIYMVLAQPSRLAPLTVLVGLAKLAGIFRSAATQIGWCACLAPGDANVLYLQAMLARKSGDLRGAIGLFRRAVEADRAQALLWHAYSNALEEAGRVEASIEARTRAAWLPECPVDAINAAIKWLRAANRFDELAALLRRRILIEPARVDVLNVLARSITRTGSPRATAGTLLRRAMTLAPSDGTAFHMLCKELLIGAGDVDTTRALLADPQNRARHPDIVAFYEACIAFREAGLTDGIVDRFRSAGQRFTAMPGGRCLLRRDEIAAAIDAGADRDARESLPLPEAEQGYTLLVSCDAGYFTMFAAPLAVSAISSGVVRTMHVHMVGAPPDDAAMHDLAGGRMPVSYSFEAHDGAGFKTHCAAARFAVAPHLLRHHRRDLLIVDCDSTLKTSMQQLVPVMVDHDAGIRIRQRFVPWHVVLAGLVTIRFTTGGLAFAEILAASVRTALRGPRDWGLDQAALVSALAFARQERPDIRIRNLEGLALLADAIHFQQPGDKAHAVALRNQRQRPAGRADAGAASRRAP